MKKELYKTIVAKARAVWSFFLDLIFPIECLSCGLEGKWLCDECSKAIKFKARQYCLGCKKENVFGQFCPDCKPNYYLDGVWIAALYENELISKAIKTLKYHFIADLAADLGKLLVIFVNEHIKQNNILKPDLKNGLDWRSFDRLKALPAVVLDFNDSLIMPVPLAKRRKKWRGFNQAELLAKVLARELNLRIDTFGLIRIKHKKAQAKLNEAGRLANVKECFAWQGENLKNKNIILVDDVVTTGATLNECAKILKARGSGEVWGLVVAKG